MSSCRSTPSSSATWACAAASHPSGPRRRYIPGLLDDVLAGRINPGRVFDFETDLEHVVDGYRAMDERRAVKSLVRVAPAR
jgi:Zn-dependent alcohol dehydrogenase